MAVTKQTNGATAIDQRIAKRIADFGPLPKKGRRNLYDQALGYAAELRSKGIDVRDFNPKSESCVEFLDRIRTQLRAVESSEKPRSLLSKPTRKTIPAAMEQVAREVAAVPVVAAPVAVEPVSQADADAANLRTWDSLMKSGRGAEAQAFYRDHKDSINRAAIRAKNPDVVFGSETKTSRNSRRR